MVGRGWRAAAGFDGITALFCQLHALCCWLCRSDEALDEMYMSLIMFILRPCCLARAGGRLHQEPAPELAQLRCQESAFVSSSGLAFGPGDACRVPEVGGPRADVSFTLRRGASSAAGLLLRAWLHPADDGAVATAAALVMDWERGALQVSLAISYYPNI